uniref:Uncharacterized protein n=1 Tax=Anguilla anguilla TaxID=7936 RepID=A0A0E9UXZ5_ANGAN
MLLPRLAKVSNSEKVLNAGAHVMK